MYAIQNVRTGEFLCGTDFGYGPGANRQRTSLEQMLTYESLRWAKTDLPRQEERVIK